MQYGPHRQYEHETRHNTDLPVFVWHEWSALQMTPVAQYAHSIV